MSIINNLWIDGALNQDKEDTCICSSTRTVLKKLLTFIVLSLNLYETVGLNYCNRPSASVSLN